MKETHPQTVHSYLALGLGALMAILPSVGLFSKLGDPGHWPLHLGFAGVGCALLLKAWSSTTSATYKLSWPVLVWLGLALWAWVAPWMTDLYSVAEWKYSAGRFTGYLGFLLLGGLWAHASSEARAQFTTFILGFGLMLSLHYVLTFMAKGSDALEDPYLVPGLMGHKNFTASAIALTLPIVVLGRSRQLWPSWFADAALWLGVLAVLMAQTRSIWLGGALALGVGVALGWRPAKTVRYGLVGGLAVAGLLAMSGPVQKRLMDPANLQIRQIFWDHSFQMQAEHPLAGVGPGQWRIHFPKYGLEGMNPSVAEGVTSEVRPHNDFIWVLSELGYVGLALFLVFFITVVVHAVRAYRKDSAELGHATWVAILILVSVYALFEFPLERAAFWAPFMVMVGLRSRGGVSVPKGVYLGLAVVSVGLLGRIAWQAIQADRANQIVLEQNSRKDARGIVQSATDAVSSWNELDRFSNPLIYFAGMGSLFGEAQAMGPNPTFTSTNFKQAEAYFNEALALHPYHVVTLYQKANMHRYRRELAQAQSTYEQLLAISPRHPGGQMHYATTLNATGQYEAAARVLIAAFLTPEYYNNPDYQRAVIEALRGMPATTKHQGLQRFIAVRNQANDPALFEAFQAFKQQRWQQEQAG
jgi:O-antigen ligase